MTSAARQAPITGQESTDSNTVHEQFAKLTLKGVPAHARESTLCRKITAAPSIEEIKLFWIPQFGHLFNPHVTCAMLDRLQNVYRSTGQLSGDTKRVVTEVLQHAKEHIDTFDDTGLRILCFAARHFRFCACDIFGSIKGRLFRNERWDLSQCSVKTLSVLVGTSLIVEKDPSLIIEAVDEVLQSKGKLTGCELKDLVFLLQSYNELMQRKRLKAVPGFYQRLDKHFHKNKILDQPASILSWHIAVLTESAGHCKNPRLLNSLVSYAKAHFEEMKKGCTLAQLDVLDKAIAKSEAKSDAKNGKTTLESPALPVQPRVIYYRLDEHSPIVAIPLDDE